MPTKTLLTPSEYDEISFVDEGANQEAHILIFKASTPDTKKLVAPRNTAPVKSTQGKQKKEQPKKKQSQRARNWVEANHKRHPKGHPKGGHFAPADSSEKERQKKGKFNARTKSGKLKGAYKVKKGDTLWALAQRYLGDGRRWKEIAKLNGVKDPRKLQIGKELKIPGGTFTHPGSWAGEKPRKNTKKQQAAVDRMRARNKSKSKSKKRPAYKPAITRKPVVARKPARKSNYRSGSRSVAV